MQNLGQKSKHSFNLHVVSKACHLQTAFPGLATEIHGTFLYMLINWNVLKRTPLQRRKQAIPAFARLSFLAFS